MRLVFLALVLSARFATAQPAPSDAEHTSRLEGRVLSTTGEPVGKATVHLGNDSLTYVDTSDHDGKFLFENVQPGSYTLSARRAGFVGQYETSPYVLTAGQVVKDVVMKLPKQGTISGRVIDQDGDPIPKAEVEALSRNFVTGQRVLGRASGASTDNQGGFLIDDLSPGRYYILVVDHPENRGIGIPGRSGPVSSSVSTFYPSELEADSAVPLDVAAGSELQGITIKVRSERVYTIRGKVTGLSSKELASPHELLIVRTGDKTARWVHPSMSLQVRPPDGTFESTHVPAGTYSLQTGAQGFGPSSDDRGSRTGRVEVTVSDADVEGVLLDLRPAVEITGTIRVEDIEPPHMSRLATPAELGHLWVGLEESEASDAVDPGGGRIPIKDDGTFRFGRLGPARYEWNLASVPEGTYLKSVRFGDQDVMHAPLDLTSGAGGAIDILLGKNPAEVSGTVHTDEADPRRAVLVTVALWPITPESGIPREGRKWVFAGRQMEFQFKGLAPGEYYLTAWAEAGPGLLESTDFRARVQPEASRVTLEEGSRETIELKLLPQDEIAAEEAKLR
jgi:hypothetical protein